MTIKTELLEPILFRTTNHFVHDNTLATGELWLRSGEYYQNLEDKIRNDELEGVNGSRTTIPIAVDHNGIPMHIMGGGIVGQSIRPHYILSLHGTSISEQQRASFGGHTFGVKAVSKLIAELYFRASKQISCSGYRAGPVSYRFINLTLSRNAAGVAIAVGDAGSNVGLGAIETDVLIKRPIAPFIEQDEWRIVLFTDGYVDSNPNEPLKLKVDPGHFYPYMTDQTATVSQAQVPA